MPSYARRGEGFTRTYDLLEDLQNDLKIGHELLEGNPESQYFRRCVVRAIFAYLEALIECIKIELRSTIRLKKYACELTKSELKTLNHLRVITPVNGKFLPLEKNIHRTFELAAKVWGLNFQLSTSNENYKDFLYAKSARNCLTHPKTYYDIQVTDADMYYHTSTCSWITEEFRRLFKMHMQNIAREG